MDTQMQNDVQCILRAGYAQQLSGRNCLCNSSREESVEEQVIACYLAKPSQHWSIYGSLLICVESMLEGAGRGGGRVMIDCLPPKIPDCNKGACSETLATSQ